MQAAAIVLILAAGKESVVIACIITVLWGTARLLLS